MKLFSYAVATNLPEDKAIKYVNTRKIHQLVILIFY